MNTLRKLIIIMWIFLCPIDAVEEGCNSPQYVELGHPGTIYCSFQGSYVGIYWYDSEDYINEDPVLNFQGSAKYGKGYLSGEFDIHPNGSLVIKEVLMQHDHIFTVVKRVSGEILAPFIVLVIVTVTPSPPHPVIQSCGTESHICFVELHEPTDLRCLVENSRPAVDLTWRIPSVERNASSSISTEQEGDLYTTVTSSNTLLTSSIVTLLVCEALGPPPVLDRNESIILVQNGTWTLSSEKPNKMYIEENSRMEIYCAKTTKSSNNFVVWKMAKHSSDEFSNILFAVFLERNFTKVILEDFELGNEGSLTTSRVGIKHQGIYVCIHGSGTTEGSPLSEVVVYAQPVPGHPAIEGCNHKQYCTLEIEAEDKLTCRVTNIYPEVQLVWKTLEERDSSLVTFTNPQTTIKDNGGKFDVILTSQVSSNAPYLSRFTIQCTISGENSELFDLATTVDILLKNGVSDSTTVIPTEADNKYWIIGVVLPVTLIVAVVVFFVIRNAHRTEKETVASFVDELENIPMIAKGGHHNVSAELKETFITQIKRKYEDLYDSVQPIPYIRDRLYCVDKVFVESGIEQLSSQGKGETWELLSSYHSILKEPLDEGTRVIVEGEPGYGKSTLSLQLVYDWCNGVPDSPLKNADILIFLRLRQLGGIKSIVRAIKQFILPKDSVLKETDIKNILYECQSLVFILDGYDEFPDDDSDITSDVINIITRDIFQQCPVILTTRSSYLPPKYASHTKRLKLTGFDEKARDFYIRKAVVGNDEDAAKIINQRLRENPVLGDLCQVPLFFVMFAHMTHERDEFQQFNSVTTFFRYMISCFHSHMRLKMEDENVEKAKLYENDHSKLDKIVFKRLSGKIQSIVWDREVLRKRIGKGFYDQYIRTGILVEEEFVKLIHEPMTETSSHIQYKTEVRFYHKLFCEWYAAHHLAKSLTRMFRVNVSNTLQNMDPFDLQYVYRFACGLNPNAAKQIIQYLQKSMDGDKFAILCILEQTGDVGNIKETVQELCSSGVEINVSESNLLQRSTIQLLGIAFRNEVVIPSLTLDGCLRSVDVSAGDLNLRSGLKLPKLSKVNNLLIRQEGNELNENIVTDLFVFALLCTQLKTLTFRLCQLPGSFADTSHLSALASRNIEVKWLSTSGLLYRLNLQSGHWEDFFDETPRLEENTEEKSS